MRNRAAAAVIAAAALLAVARPAAPGAAPARPVTYSKTLCNHVTLYAGAAGRPAADPEAGVYAIGRIADEEVWVGPDGARVARGHEGAPYPISAADERAWRAAGSPDLQRLMGRSHYGNHGSTVRRKRIDDMLLGSGELSHLLPAGAPYRDMPRAASDLKTYLVRTAWRQRTELSGEGDAACVADEAACPAAMRERYTSLALTYAVVMLEDPRAPAALRTGLIELFRGLPRTRSLGKLIDRAGRTGDAIGLSGSGADGLNVLLIDGGSRLLAEGSANPPDAAHLRWYRTLAVERGRVARIGERPAAN